MTLLTTEDAAKADGCQPITARIWAKKNGVKMFGSTYMWSMEEVDTFCARNKLRGWKLGRPRKNNSQTS
jgi:hypothetical protein